VADRDYAAEMRAIIDTDVNPADGPYEARVAASKIVAKLRETDPEFLAACLDAQADQIWYQAIIDRDRSRRSHERATGGRSVFGKAAKEFDDGDADALGGWLTVPFVVDGNIRKPLGLLTAPDLLSVAAGYQRRADESVLECAFFRALAKKVGKGTVGDHFTDGEVRALRESIAAVQRRRDS